MSKTVNENNIIRFSGFSDLYHTSRPAPPEILLKIILTYLKRDPGTVVDIGSGTGISTVIWKDIARRIIGIEPNDDMRETAQSNSKPENISYQKGFSHQTNLPPDFADVVTISQAFHWMDIDSTLTEVYRILKSDGVFAVYDCDWPPVIDWVVEKAYRELKNKCDDICNTQKEHAVRNDKNSYISRINAFGKFRFSREVVLHSLEKCTPERMFGFAISQGSMQDALKIDKSIQKDIDDFQDLVNTRCSGEFDIVFSYRLRLAIK